MMTRWGYWIKMPFDEAKADRAEQFFEQYLTHTKGRWAGVKFTLLPWERDLIRKAYGTVKDNGFRQYRILYCEIPKKNGKALSIETNIPTPGGWSTMGSLRPGDVVFGADGKQTNVVACSSVMTDRPCFRLRFSDRSKIIADGDHLWRTQTYKPWYRTDLRTTVEIKDTLNYQSGKNHRIGVAGKLECDKADLPIDPYTLGIWLGDGSNHNASITVSTQDIDIINKIRLNGVNVKAWGSAGIVRQYGIGGAGFKGGTVESRQHTISAKLRALDLFCNKQIPRTYLRASVEQRMELLRGLMDSDGYASKAGQCEFTTTRMSLCNDFMELARSLGYKPTVKHCRATLNGKDCGPKHRIQFFAYDNNPVFNLERKRIRLKQKPATPTRASFRKIVAVDKVRSVPVRCIQVDADDGMFLAGDGMVPTHNSELGAGFAVYQLIADGENGAEIYGAAGDREQAGLVYNVASQMVRNNPALDKRLKVIDSRKRIIDYRSNSFYQVLSAESYTKHGISPSCIIFDELHAQPNRKLWDTLIEGTDAARDQQIVVVLTTAGEFDTNSIAFEVHNYAEQVRDGIIEDPTFLPIIYAADEDDDWESSEVWEKANPSIGHIFDLDHVRTHYKQAKNNPARLNNFLRFRLNRWVSNLSRWMPMTEWDDCNLALKESELSGLPCFGGIDLSSSIDMSSFGLVFPPHGKRKEYALVMRYYMPEEKITERAKTDMVPYDMWVRAGLIAATPGNVIDYEYIRRDIKKAALKYGLSGVAYDPWGAVQLALQLQDDDGIKMVEFRQGFKSMSAPTKKLLELVKGGKLAHAGHQVLRWNVDNLVVKTDPAENIKPEKSKSTGRIDGAVAIIMALGLAINRQEPAAAVPMFL
jgi:phage terminase large subunit-like protein